MTEWVDVETTGIAHGGEAVARHEGRVIFVRGALPDERVRVRITDAPAHGRFRRGVVEEVLQPSPDRVQPPCRYADRCGGCDWQFAAVPAQRELKARVVREQLQRLGGEPADRWADLLVEAVPGDVDGLRWRTRMRYAVDGQGRAGLRPHHSHDILPIDQCLLAAPDVEDLDVLGRSWPGVSEILAVTGDEESLVLPDPRPGMAKLTETALGRTWTLDATAFWQVHPGAAETLATSVLDLIEPRPGEHVVDLYSGVGLFAGAVLSAIGPGGRIDAVESSAVAVKGARRSLHEAEQVHLHEARVDRWLRDTPLRRCDVVILDPPRAGAGREVLHRIFRLKPRGVAYVACDPAALARDVAIARDEGWHLASLRAFDLFPMTHHVECVALLEPIDTVKP